MGQITFKGTKDGIYLRIDGQTTQWEIKNFLRQIAPKDLTLLKGAELIGIRGKDPSFMEKLELYKILTEELEMKVLSLDKEAEEEKVITVTKEVEKQVDVIIPTKLVNHTIRSGSVIEHDGDIIVIGDVNPGAELKAGGNIVVFGSLKGIAHAGIHGNLEAVVIAEDLEPTQLRIGHLITRAPDDGYDKPAYSEKAFIKDNMIYIEPTKN